MSDNESISTLQLEVSQLNGQVEPFNQTSDNATAMENYQAIISQIGQLPDSLDKHAKMALLVRDPNVKGDLSLSESEKEFFKKCEKACENFIKRWNKEDYNANQGNDLEKFSTALKSLAEGIKSTNENLWTQWIGDLRASFQVEDYLLEAQKGLDEVERRREEFVKNSQAFDERTKYIPNDKNGITEIQSLVEKLRILSSQMDHDVPEVVRKFLEYAGDINKGAPIKLLTPEVIDYLEKKDALQNFVVKRSGHRRGY